MFRGILVLFVVITSLSLSQTVVAQRQMTIAISVEYRALKEGGEMVDGEFVAERNEAGGSCQLALEGRLTPGASQVIVRNALGAIVGMSDTPESVFLEDPIDPLRVVCQGVLSIEVPAAEFFTIHLDDRWVAAVDARDGSPDNISIVI